ncbi:20S proteasome alpha subunit PAD1, partial [Striga asiatica]
MPQKKERPEDCMLTTRAVTDGNLAAGIVGIDDIVDSKDNDVNYKLTRNILHEDSLNNCCFCCCVGIGTGGPTIFFRLSRLRTMPLLPIYDTIFLKQKEVIQFKMIIMERHWVLLFVHGLENRGVSCIVPLDRKKNTNTQAHQCCFRH